LADSGQLEQRDHLEAATVSQVVLPTLQFVGAADGASSTNLLVVLVRFLASGFHSPPEKGRTSDCIESVLRFAGLSDDTVEARGVWLLQVEVSV